MSPSIEFRDKAKGERAVKALLKKRIRNQVDVDTGIPGAGKQMEKLEKRIKDLEDLVAKISGQYDKLWAWKVQQEMKGEAD